MAGALATATAACDGEKGSSAAAYAGPTGPSAHVLADTGGGGGGGGGGGAGGSPVTKYQSDGDAAYVNWYTFSGGDTLGGYTWDFGYLSVQRGGTPSARTTYLSYSYTCSDFEVGSGAIRNGDLTTGGRQWHLKVSATSNPSFGVWAGSGNLDIRFNTTGLYSTSSNGVSINRYGNLTVQTEGQSSYASASVTGSIGAAAIPPQTYGSVGSSKQLTIWRFHS
jgi:hypothetical protein